MLFLSLFPNSCKIPEQIGEIQQTMEALRQEMRNTIEHTQHAKEDSILADQLKLMNNQDQADLWALQRQLESLQEELENL